MKKPIATDTSKNLLRLLREMPDSVFFCPTSGRTRYNRIFAEVIKIRMGLENGDDIPLAALWSDDCPKISTMQRSVALEAKKRKKLAGIPASRDGRPPKNPTGETEKSEKSEPQGGGE